MTAKVLLGAGSRNDGPCWYRVELPARWLRGRGVDVRVLGGEQEEETGVLVGATTFSTQRGVHPSLVTLITELKKRGCRTVYELDDDAWSVPDWNPLRSTFTQEYLRRMEAVMRAVDVVTVSTDRLARLVVRHGVGEIHVVPNAVPIEAFRVEREQTLPGVRIGWWGSDTHGRDLAIAMPALKRVLLERPEVTVVLMGCTVPTALAAFADRIEWHDWVDPEGYYSFLQALEIDVLFAPLEDHRFNYAKSAVKVIEAGAMGLAIVASDVGPYQVIRNGETGFKVKANRPDLWNSLLMDVVKDERLRAKLGAGARQWVEKECSMEQTGPLWAAALGVTI